MRVLESQWWMIELPDEWHAEQEDETIIIGDEDGVGEIAITTLQKEQGQVSETELKEYTEEVESQYGAAKRVELAELSGFYFSFSEDGDFFREWYLYCDDLLLLISYCCDEENAGMDDAVVDEILDTIYIKADESPVPHPSGPH